MTEAEQTFYVSPIANPIANSKLQKGLLRFIARQITIKHIKRGVKEVGKALRKKTTGIVVFAADISPVDVLSHLPLQCEELGIPYIYVRSRLELGAAAQTKKPTSVVLVQVPTKDDVKGLEKYHELFDKVKESNPFI
ncbi:unnamed protein product (macronuclear) [Paramecium tetraurelia]|uniref:H/ACA ribonucleoprotein complex subunit 2 n=1 Tax=Paramecium tetraurelia TaxID=5888 RepID=A0DUU0_PARTE|nr:uncharacterized protein GSPATT00020469001 [Paramecium tetraurelia]CAK86807.1 unnamed protein product [Paramecium tetraurelia]|eukprot:XP_001454204.1 hypothetical protein (macronuclear) [Paramecium tetraurelia strain d4-2]